MIACSAHNRVWCSAGQKSCSATQRSLEVTKSSTTLSKSCTCNTEVESSAKLVETLFQEACLKATDSVYLKAPITPCVNHKLPLPVTLIATGAAAWSATMRRGFLVNAVPQPVPQPAHQQNTCKVAQKSAYNRLDVPRRSDLNKALPASQQQTSWQSSNIACRPRNSPCRLTKTVADHHTCLQAARNSADN